MLKGIDTGGVFFSSNRVRCNGCSVAFIRINGAWAGWLCRLTLCAGLASSGSAWGDESTPPRGVERGQVGSAA